MDQRVIVDKNMPIISTFYGIIVQMFWDDHAPPHFHVKYAGYKAVINIRELKLANGVLPNKALELVLDWAELYQDELMANWELAVNGNKLFDIKPLA